MILTHVVMFNSSCFAFICERWGGESACTQEQRCVYAEVRGQLIERPFSLSAMCFQGSNPDLQDRQCLFTKPFFYHMMVNRDCSLYWI